jgi:cell division septation protein DedD
MSNNEAKNRSQTLPYLKALLTHSTPCHNPKNTQENTSLSPTPKKCLHKHEHKYARHKSPTKTKQQVSHCINKPAGLALHQQTSRSRTASTNKHFSHCTHMSRGKLENVSTNTQNGPKSKQRFDLLHKRKQKHTHHKPKTTQSPDLTLKALLTHSTPCHNPKNTQENALLAPTPKKCLHEHEHKYARHSPSTNNNQQALHCTKEPVGLALLQTSKSRTMSTNQLASHCIHRSRGKSENVSKNTQNGPKSKQ